MGEDLPGFPGTGGQMHSACLCSCAGRAKKRVRGTFSGQVCRGDTPNPPLSLHPRPEILTRIWLHVRGFQPVWPLNHRSSAYRPLLQLRAARMVVEPDHLDQEKRAPADEQADGGGVGDDAGGQEEERSEVCERLRR